MKSIFISIFFLLLLSNSGGFTQEIPRLSKALSPESRQKLEKGEQLLHYFYKADEIQYLPEMELSKALRQKMKKLDLSIGVEILVKIKMPDYLRKMEKQKQKLHIYNQLRSVSTLKGIEYFSQRRNRMRIFFIESYHVPYNGSRNPLPDPLVKIIPPKDSIIVFQEDSSFGQGYSLLEYEKHDSCFLLSTLNLTEIKYGIIKICDPKQMSMNILVYPDQDEIYLYGLSGVKTMSFLGIERLAEEKFYNRLNALQSWFVKNIRKPG